jgi:hypothetical protein
VTVEVVPVTTKQQREQFLRLPWSLYRGIGEWVPNLLMLQREVIDEKKNPFFEIGEARLFLALKDGKPAGRISASIDRRHLQRHEEQTGFFGFFESTDDVEVAKALLETAEGWLHDRGMQCVRGPFSFSINEECGLQVEGFDQPAMIQMPQSLPYYPGLLEAAGYTKAMDLLAYRWDFSDPPARIREAVEKTRAVPGLTLRTIRMRRLSSEVDILLDLYNETWQENWGYVQVTRSEAAKMVSDLRLIADPRVIVIAELHGKPVGMVVGLPNFYESIRDFRGFIDPIKALKLVWRLKIRGTETGRILLFGVRKEHRTRELYGLPFLLLHQLYLNAKTRRYKWCEESWILENNGPMNALMPYWDAYVYKRYRIFEKAIA